MRPILLLAAVPVFLSAAPDLQIVHPAISQMEGGVPDTPGYEHVGGETLFLSCRVSGYSKSPESLVRLTYSVQVSDPKGVPLVELYKNSLTEEVTSQDKEWLPKIATAVQIPPLVPPGTYKILVKVEDLEAKTSAELPVPFQVRGRQVEPSDTLMVRNFRYYRGEEATRPLPKPVYHAGDSLWARFEITGFKFADGNRVDVSYRFSVLGSDGKVLFTQPEPAVEASESFYPRPYVPAEFSVDLRQGVRPGEYGLSVKVTDGVGKQSYELKSNFTVE